MCIFFSRQHSFTLHASSFHIELAAPGRNMSILLLCNVGKEFNFPSETLCTSQTRCHCGHLARYLKKTMLSNVFERIFRRVEVLLLQ